MGKTEVSDLFKRKIRELREKDPEKVKKLLGELMEWAAVVSAPPDAYFWDILYSQIQWVAGRQKISEEQVLSNLFAQGTVDGFMLLLQLG
jgi:hypothetical protein